MILSKHPRKTVITLALLSSALSTTRKLFRFLGIIKNASGKTLMPTDDNVDRNGGDIPLKFGPSNRHLSGNPPSLRRRSSCTRLRASASIDVVRLGLGENRVLCVGRE